MTFFDRICSSCFARFAAVLLHRRNNHGGLRLREFSNMLVLASMLAICSENSQNYRAMWTSQFEDKFWELDIWARLGMGNYGHAVQTVGIGITR